MGLIAHYRLDGSAEDAVGNNPLTVSTNITYESGKLAQAARFNGSSSYLRTNNFYTGPCVSISFWAKLNSFGDNWFVGKRDNGSNKYWQIQNYSGSGNEVTLSLADNSGKWVASVQANPGLKAGVWYHFAATTKGTKGSKAYIYVNGKREGESTLSGDINVGDSRPVVIGCRSWDYGRGVVDGVMQDVRIYDHALSPREVRDLSLGLVGHYPLLRDAINAAGYDSGSLQGSVVFSDVMGGSAEFDNSSYIQLETGVTGDPDELSASFWAKTDSLQTYDGLLQFDGVSSYEDGFVITGASSTTMRFRYWSDGGTNTTWTAGDFAAGKETHFCVTLKDNLFTLYQDGEKVGERTYSNPFNLSGGVKLGLYSWSSNYFTGWIKDSRIYATALTPAQVKELYQQRASIDSEGSVHLNLAEPVRDHLPLDIDRWVISDQNLSLVVDETSVDDQCMYLNTGSTDQLVIASRDVSDISPTYVSFRWLDNTYGRGGGISLKNQNGDEILGFGSDNPEWFVIDADGSRGVGVAGDYGVWTRAEARVGGSKYTLDISDEDGRSIQVNGSLSSYGPVHTVDIMSADPNTRTNGWTAGQTARIKYDGFTFAKDSLLNRLHSSEVGVTRGLVAWYPLIGDTLDYAGTNHAENNGAVATAEGYEFDGEDDYLGVEDVNLGGEVTMSALVKISGYVSGSRTIGYMVYDGSANGWRMFLNADGTVGAWVQNSSSSTATIGSTSSKLSLGEVTHLTLVLTPNSQKIYFNGVEEVSNSIQSNPFYGKARLFGYTKGGYVFDGVGSDVRIHNVALTPEEVAIQAKLALSQNHRTAFTQNCMYTRGQIKEVIA